MGGDENSYKGRGRGGVSSVEGTSEQTPEDARERSRRAKKK